MNLPMNRREFVGLTACAVAGTVLLHNSALAAPSNVQIQAVAFDAFPILDPRPIFALTEEMFPGKEPS
jgi:2-haloacid dehalogenase